MNKFDLGQRVATLANIGVIAGIAFLAFELRQNNDLLGVEMRAAALDRQVSMIDVVLNNSELDLMALQSLPVEDLTPEDRDKLILLGIRMLIVFQQSFEEVQAGLRDEEYAIPSLRSVYRRPVLNYGTPLAWATFRERANPDFIEWMEENIIQ